MPAVHMQLCTTYGGQLIPSISPCKLVVNFVKNVYLAHSANIIIAMLQDDRQYIRELELTYVYFTFQK